MTALDVKGTLEEALNNVTPIDTCFGRYRGES
jgi:hypothetical protein